MDSIHRAGPAAHRLVPLIVVRAHVPLYGAAPTNRPAAAPARGRGQAAAGRPAATRGRPRVHGRGPPHGGRTRVAGPRGRATLPTVPVDPGRLPSPHVSA